MSHTPTTSALASHRDATPQDLMNLMANLGEALTRLTANVDKLTTTINNLATRPAANISSSATKVVEKPARFNGKDLEKAWQFRNAFTVYVQNNMRTFGAYHPDGSPHMNINGEQHVNTIKAILSMLSFMDNDAAIWARPHIESIASRLPVFNNDWDKFIEAFKSKFEPVNEQAEACLRLERTKQGDKQKFSEYFANFNTWSEQTGYGSNKVFDRCRLGLNKHYLGRLTYFDPPATDLNTLETYCKWIDANLADLANAELRKGGHISSSSTNGSTGFSTGDAMDIDAAKIDHLITSKNCDEIYKQYLKIMKGRCRVCGSQNHTTEEDKHKGKDTTCNHCQGNNHWSAMCIRQLQGLPAGPKKAPSCNVSVTSVDVEQENASLKTKSIFRPNRWLF